MLHLLTEEHRKKIIREYRKRVMIVSLLCLSAVILISTVLLLPSFIISYGKYSEVRNRLVLVEADLGAKNTDNSVADLKDIADSVIAIKLFADQKPLLPVIQDIVSARLDGITFKGFVFTPNQVVTGDTLVSPLVIDISGQARSRKDLVALQDKMKANPYFDSVLIPLSNFAKEKDILFSMKLIVSTTTKTYTLSDTIDKNAIGKNPNNTQ